MQDNNQQHEMILDKAHPAGAEEWCCPTCGRRFVMQWSPKYKRIILDDGDAYAVHSGGKGGLKMGAARVTSNNSPSEDLRLEQWEDWFTDIDFDEQ